MPKKIFSLALALSLLGFPLLAVEKQENPDGDKNPLQIQHEITVTATRMDTPTREIGSSVTIITRQDIESSQKVTVLEILQDIPGVTVIQNGPAGAAGSVHIRGGNAEHTLVMMDGVELNDPITPSRSIDLAHYTLDNVERIEILRGPQSTLYGSDALSGVINIITKKGDGQPTIDFSAQGGSYGSFAGSTVLSGSADKFFYSVGTSFFQNTGFSAASQDYEGNTEKDGYSNLTFTGRLGFRLSDSFEFDLSARRVETEIDIDNFGGAYGDDPNNLQTYDSLFIKGQARIQLWNNRWEQKLNLAFVDYDRAYENSTDAAHPFDSEEAFYKSTFLKFDWQNHLYLHETHTLTFGIDFQQEQGESEHKSESFWGPFLSLFPLQKASTTGLYIQDQIRLADRFYATVGTRLDFHSQFGTSLTYRVAPAYVIGETGTKIKGSIGTGFKSPSLYQLFAPGTLWGPIGNKNLEPEKSTGWDIGIEQELCERKVFLSATYFSHSYKNLIDFDFLKGYVNITEAESNGLELTFEAFLTDGLSVSANYTRQESQDRRTGKALLRRPKDFFQARLNLRFLKIGHMNLSVISLGKRDDIEFVGYSSQRVTMPSYTLVNATASFALISSAQIYLRIENILNTHYEIIKGFGTPGFSAFGGLKLHF
ncbi:MAG: TonB-dependent receptor [Candidatus Aminicenantes bacterium]|jgi:vitamin B12 transporter